MTEEQAIAVLEERQNKLINYNEFCDTQEEYEQFLGALEVALVALRRGDTLAISHGWSKENFKDATEGVITTTASSAIGYKVYDMQQRKWIE